MSLLVDYGSSDSEDNCDESVSCNLPDTIASKILPKPITAVDNENKYNVLKKSLPKAAANKAQELIIQPSKKELALREKPPVVSTRNKIFINLPSIEHSDSEDETGPPKKKIHHQSDISILKGLPPPKFVKAEKAASKSYFSKASVTQDEYYDDEFDDDVGDKMRKEMNFLTSIGDEEISTPQFSSQYMYDEDEEVMPVEVEEGRNFLLSSIDDENMPSSFHESSKYKYEENVDISVQYPGAYQSTEAAQATIPQDFARDAQFKKIMESQAGSNFVDVNLDEHLKQYEPARLRELTQGPASGTHKATGNTQGRRKHQITYLATQAKERETDLKNQWAESRFNRKQTQSKYGF